MGPLSLYGPTREIGPHQPLQAQQKIQPNLNLFGLFSKLDAVVLVMTEPPLANSIDTGS